MYVNFEVFRQRGLQEKDIFILCAIKAKDLEHLNGIDNSYFKEGSSIFQYLKFIKKKTKDQPDTEVVRLNPKGEKLLKDISSSSKITEETKAIGEWLISYYKQRDGGIVKNKAETLRRIQWFTDYTGVTKNHLAVLLKCFISDTYRESSGLSLDEFKKENPRMQLSNIADDIFWKPRNLFSKHYNIDDSPLGIYLEEFRDYVEEQFKKHGLQ